MVIKTLKKAFNQDICILLKPKYKGKRHNYLWALLGLVIQNLDLAGFLEYIEVTGATICGRYPIAILLAMLPDEAKVHLLKYSTSGHISGDWSHCVSYVSAAVAGGCESPKQTV